MSAAPLLDSLNPAASTQVEVALLGLPGQGRQTLARALAARLRQRLAGRAVRRPRRLPEVVPQPIRLEGEHRTVQLHHRRDPTDLLELLLHGRGRLAGGLLVVDAATPEGDWPDLLAALADQVRVARLTGVPEILAFLARAESVPALRREEREMSLRLLLHEQGYPGDDALIVPGDAWSVLCSDGKDDESGRPLDELTLRLLELRGEQEPAGTRPFRMRISGTGAQRRGRHAVAHGVIEQGRIRVGHRVELLGTSQAPTTAVVLGLRRFHRFLETAQAGEAIQLHLRGGLDSVLASTLMLCRPDTVSMHRELEVLTVLLGSQDTSRTAAGLASFETSWGPHQISLSLELGTELGRWLAGSSARARLRLPTGVTLPAHPGMLLELRGRAHARALALTLGA